MITKKNLLKKSVEYYEKELESNYKKKEEKLNQMFSGGNQDDEETLEEKKELLRLKRKKRIFRKYFKYQKLDCYDMLKNCDNDLSQLEVEFVKITDGIKSSRAKNTFEQIQENSDHVRNFKIKLENLEHEVVNLYEEKKISTKEIFLLENCCAKIKEIQMYKSCSQTLDKLFYNVKLPCLKCGMPKTTLDDIIRPAASIVSSRVAESPVMLGTTNSNHFINCFNIITKMIENDWSKLYMNLPFYPERGIENKKKDIEEVYYNIYRGNVLKEQSFNSLNKWKRLHARAKIEDLPVALKKINRVDIGDLVTNYINNTQEMREKLKASSRNKFDVKLSEAEILHQNLIKFFERRNAGDFKFKVFT